MSNLTEHWAELIKELTLKPELIIAGVQRIHSNYVWEVPAMMFFGKKAMSLEETGYTTNKIKQLVRNYEPKNVERAIEDLKWRIEKKKYGSGVIYFQGLKKKGTKQDWCMTGMVVSFYPQLKSTRVTIFYRTAESIKRFRGDLVYLTKYVFPKFAEVFKLAPPTTVTFNFANITLHPMFWLLSIEHMPRWANVLKHVENKNPKLFRNIVYWSWRYLLDTSKSIDSYSSARQVRLIALRCISDDNLRDFKAWLRAAIADHLEHLPDSVRKGRWKK